ncbi:glycoside hydrolase domain-containing protein [Streptomyces sp. NRRL WC-3742]|uniref:glycoside hydrolase domain-containing protein n=1 Tax=Streptomyces sp. NRRL WC-3742 TaxID=1463934 RepID=UPI000B173C4E|nr:glycoside hydrolase domain-containing protein [Streptomyces sp. NRRL WC-3742]
MSHQHNPGSTTGSTTRRNRAIALSAAGVILAAGATTLAVTGLAGNSTPSSATTAASAAGGDSAATTAPPSPSDSGAPGSPSASPSASPTATKSASASATPSRPASSTTPPPTPGAAGQPAAAPVANVPAPARGPAVFTGKAFDTCTAPPAATMQAWHGTSPYGAAAVYIGGQNRGCAQPNLTPSWVRTVHTAGWQLIPLYVGAQPPCQTSNNPERITAANAATLGTADGADAVTHAAALGMGAGSAIYLDMEAYNASDTACSAAVLTYVQAWDAALHSRGYFAGFYGFSKSSALAMSQAATTGAPGLPDALWYALYDGTADTTSGFPFPADQWSGARRGHQYAVNKQESYGGSSLTIDQNAWNAPVAVIS